MKIVVFIADTDDCLSIINQTGMAKKKIPIYKNSLVHFVVTELTELLWET